MRRPRTALICAVAIVAIVGALAAGIALLSATERPRTGLGGSVTFLGYTNDASGIRVARFAITNLSTGEAARSWKCLVWTTPPGGQWTPYFAFLFRGTRVLGAGASEIVTVPPPMSESPWRISIYLSDDVGGTWPIKRLVNGTLGKIGLPERYGFTTRQIDSGLIESQR